MLTETLKKIELRITASDSVNQNEKEELLDLLSILDTEITVLAKTHPEEAESITGFTQVSAHEATREQRNPQLVTLSIDGLRSSIKGFESSHEDLVKIVNSLAYMLANIGI
jgi:hypothetical protein